MTFIYVPPYHGRNAPWPPTGRPVGSYDTHKQAQRAIAFLVEREIPRQDLAVLNVTTWRPGIVAVVAGAAAGVPIGLVEGSRGWVKLAVLVVWTMAAIAVLLGAVLAVTGYRHDRRVRRFVRSTSPTVVGRHVVLCAPGNADRARDLLAALEGTESALD